MECWLTIGIDQLIDQLCAADHGSKALLEAFGSFHGIILVPKVVELFKSAQYLPRSRPYSMEMRSAT
jgi:hypothetical protein